MRLRSLFALGRWPLALAFSLFFLHAHAALPPDQSPAQMLASTDPTDAHIAETTADVLQTLHYSQHPFDQEIAGKFLDRYLDMLDYFHLYFLQSDIDEFSAYRTNLDVLTLKNHDIRPCWIIFIRFMDRANQRASCVSNLLATQKFDFTGQDRFVANRHTLPYPKDLAQATEFWRQEFRCEYLDHLLPPRTSSSPAPSAATPMATSSSP